MQRQQHVNFKCRFPTADEVYTTAACMEFDSSGLSEATQQSAPLEPFDICTT